MLSKVRALNTLAIAGNGSGGHYHAIGDGNRVDVDVYLKHLLSDQLRATVGESRFQAFAHQRSIASWRNGGGWCRVKDYRFGFKFTKSGLFFMKSLSPLPRFVAFRNCTDRQKQRLFEYLLLTYYASSLIFCRV